MLQAGCLAKGAHVVLLSEQGKSSLGASVAVNPLGEGTALSYSPAKTESCCGAPPS